jgi:chaperonin GroEL
MGPQGLAMAVNLDDGPQVVTRSGSLIARALTSAGFEDRGVQELREVTQEMDDAMGDGAKIAALLTADMVERGDRAIREGHLPRDVVEGMRLAIGAAKSSLANQRRLAEGKGDIQKIAATAADSDAIGSLVVSAMEKVGRDGVITVYESDSDVARVEVLEGVQFDRGFISPHFVTDPVKMEVTLEDVFILIHDQKISSMKNLLPVLESVAHSGKALLVIADDVEGEALATLVVNALRGTLRLAAVKSPGLGERRLAMLQDIAVLTGGQVVSYEAGLLLENAVISDLGRAKRIVVGKEATTIVGGAGEQSQIDLRADAIRAAIQRSGDDYEREYLHHRLARLAGAIANIVVGGITFSDTFEAKYRVWSALHSARKAVENGVVVGGGKAFVNAINDTLSVASRNPAEAAGVKAVAGALESPIRCLISSARLNESDVLDGVRAGGIEFSLNAASGELQNLVDAGVLDPELTLSRALDVALAHTKKILLTDRWDLSALAAEVE